MRRGRKQRTQGRRQTTQDTNHKCASMDDMDNTHEAILSHKCDVKPLCINGRRAVCSELRVVRVRVRDGVHVVHRIVLKRDVVIRKGVRNVVAIRSHFCIVNCSWIWGAGSIPSTVLELCCEGQANVWEMFSDNSYLSAILDRQGLWLQHQ